MKKLLKATLFLSLVAVGASPVFAQQPSTAAWDSVGRILGTAPTSAAGYIRYNLPRRDLTVRIGDVTVAPALALGAWAGFSGEPNDATMMGDLVLTAAELGPVLAELAHQRIGVSAIHNHIVGEQPEVIYVHILGQGSALELATRLDRAVTKTGTPRPVAPAPSVPLSRRSLFFLLMLWPRSSPIPCRRFDSIRFANRANAEGVSDSQRSFVPASYSMRKSIASRN